MRLARAIALAGVLAGLVAGAASAYAQTAPIPVLPQGGTDRGGRRSLPGVRLQLDCREYLLGHV